MNCNLESEALLCYKDLNEYLVIGMVVALIILIFLILTYKYLTYKYIIKKPSEKLKNG